MMKRNRDCEVFEGEVVTAEDTVYVLGDFSDYRDASRQSVCVSAERIGYASVEFGELRERMV